MRILLTGARAPVTLDLARHFHRAGHEVVLADSIWMPVAAPSRASRGTFKVTRPVSNPRQFVRDLARIIRHQRIDLVVPTCEEIFFIAARREMLAGITNVFAEPLERLTPLHNKWEFVQLVNALNGAARAPETRLLKSQGDVSHSHSWRDSAGAVFKPVYSRFAARTLIGPTPAQLSALRPTTSDPWVVQRRIRGQEYSTYSVAHSGHLRAHACYRSEYRAGPGSGIYFLPVNEPRIRLFVEQFVARQQFTGQIGFDFIAGEDGEMYVLECNPRATSGLHMLDAEPLADAFVNPAGALLEPSSQQPKMLSSIMFLYPFPQTLRRGGVAKFFHDMWRARDVIFDRSDFLPAFLSPLSLAEVMLTAAWTRKPLTRASTFDIEWNGEPL